MKKKLSVNTLALGNLRQHKKQYTIMIIGIILAMVFSGSVTFLASSIYSSTVEMRNERLGKQSVIWTRVTENHIENAKSSKVLGKSGYAHILGLLNSTDDEYFDSVCVGWLDDTAEELANPQLIEGKMPSAENEIAVEKMALSKLGVNASVGDYITLNLKTQNGNETLDNSHSVTYKLVGILKNKAPYISFTSGVNMDGVPCAFVCKNTAVELGGREGLTCYARYYDNRETESNYKKLEDYLLSIEYTTTANPIATFSNNAIYHTNDSDTYDIVYQIVFLIIIVAVLMLASCIIIINAFNANLNERKRQIGLLRAIGATKRQIVKIFAREAFVISIVSTPVACLLSALIVKAIMHFLGDGYSFKLNVWALLLSVLFCNASVMLSALIPLASVSRITPMQAIRNIENTRRFNKKRIKTKKTFDVSKLIAKRSLTFSKGKQVTVSIILTISIVAGGFAFSWYSYSVDNYYSLDSDYILRLSSWTSHSGVNFKSKNVGFSENDKQTVMNNEYIGECTGYKEGRVNLLVPSDTSDYRKLVSDNYHFDYDNYAEEDVNETNYRQALFSEKNNYNSVDTEKMNSLFNVSDYITTELLSYDEQYLNSLKQYVYDGKIDIEKINSGEEIILYAPSKVGMYYDSSNYGGLRTAYNEYVDKENCFFTDTCDFHAGDEMEIGVIIADEPTDSEGYNIYNSIIPDNAEVIKKKVKIGAIINGDDFLGGARLTVLTTHNVINSLIPNIKYKELYCNLNTSCTDEVDKAVVDDLKEITSNVDQGAYTSNYGFAQSQREEANKTVIVMLSVIVLLFVISISIINNTISADIRNSKQKIGTLRAVGADERELVKSYIYQLLSMLMWGVGIGLCTFGIGYLVLSIISRIKASTLEMYFNPLVAIVFVVCAVVICSINLWLKIRKETKNSVVENIREL